MQQTTNSYLNVYSSEAKVNSNNIDNSFARTMDKLTEEPKETLSAKDLTKMLEEQNSLTAKELKEDADWRDVSDDEWDKMLNEVDDYVDSYRTELRERIKKQTEAAIKAAAQADSSMKSKAAQEASLSVAASGFDGGVDSEEGDEDESVISINEDSGIDHEKNWTKKLKTDNQVILRSAKAAQDMEKMAQKKLNEISNQQYYAYSAYENSMLYIKDQGF